VALVLAPQALKFTQPVVAQQEKERAEPVTPLVLLMEHLGQVVPLSK
jgi:hypothetical protein